MLTSSRVNVGGRSVGASVAANVGAVGVGGEFGEGACPRGEALAGQHGRAERERLGTAVQGSVTQVLVSGV